MLSNFAMVSDVVFRGCRSIVRDFFPAAGLCAGRILRLQFCLSMAASFVASVSVFFVVFRNNTMVFRVLFDERNILIAKLLHWNFIPVQPFFQMAKIVINSIRAGTKKMFLHFLRVFCFRRGKFLSA